MNNNEKQWKIMNTNEKRPVMKNEEKQGNKQ
jgi:hypothetical protein